MQVKEKPCKGTSKAIGHGCGNPTFFRKYGLCNKCYRVWLLNTKEGAGIIKKFVLSAQRKIKTKERKQTREWKESHKSIAKLIQEARKPFQQWIRRRDANRLCVSCGKASEIYHGGHFKKSELYPGLIFDERNCAAQCPKCNIFLNGNEGEYRKRLIERFGQQWMDKLDEDANRLRTYKYTREELIEIKSKYKLKLKQ